MKLNEAGRMTQTVWEQLPTRFPEIELDEFVIMPNHIHGMIWILDNRERVVGAGFPRPLNPGTLNGNSPISPGPAGAETAPLQRVSLGQIVAYFKYQFTKQINAANGIAGTRLWQRNYYEHVIRNEDELFQIRRYIQENPLRWDLDPENPYRQPNPSVATNDDLC